MNRARDRTTNEFVEAEALWGQADVNLNNFLCSSCDLQVFPRSFDVTNRVRPYFVKPSGQEHAADCLRREHGQILRQARQRSVGARNGDLPIPYPHRFRPLQGRPPGEGEALPAPMGGDDARAREPNARNGPRAPARRYATSALQAICRTYIEFPHDRANLRLQLDEVEGTTYNAIFKHLEKNRIVPQERPRLFFARMRYKEDPIMSDTGCYVALNCGQDLNTPQARHCTVHINWGEWSTRDRSRVKAEIETTWKEAADPENREPGSGAWVFFLGEQDPHDLAVFEVSHPRAICCLFATISFPRP